MDTYEKGQMKEEYLFAWTLVAQVYYRNPVFSFLELFQRKTSIKGKEIRMY